MFLTDVLPATHVRADTFTVLSFRCLCTSEQTLCLGSPPLASSYIRES